jgi:hypothetical protein
MVALNWSRRVAGALLVALVLSACSGGGGGGGGGVPPPNTPAPPVPNRAPTAANDVFRAEDTALSSIAILANDTDPDGDTLTVSIEENAPLGTVGVNPNGTVRIDSLPGDFKGVTHFRYKVTDDEGLSASASAAVFVGTDPFRVLFAGDPNANGSPEVYLATFVAAPTAVTTATEGAFRLRGFAASDNGATVVYRRADNATPANVDLSFVKTATPNQAIRITLPLGTSLVQDASDKDQYRVSPNGQWIVFIVRDGNNVQSAYTLNTRNATSGTKVNVPGQYITLPRFSRDSRFLYLLASPTTDGANKSLYAAELGTASVARLSAQNRVASADNVIEYAVASDQSRILIRANRLGSEGLYFIDPAQVQTEVRVSHALAVDETLLESTTGLPPGLGGSERAQRVAYTTKTDPRPPQAPLPVYATYVAEVSATPNPRVVTSSDGSITKVLGLRPDDRALLYTRGSQIYEVEFDPQGTSDVLVGGGAEAWYDSTGGIVLLKQFLPSGGSPPTYPALAVAVRGSFGTTRPLGTAAMAAAFMENNSFHRGVTIIGEGGTTGSLPSNARLALVNAAAPDELMYLTNFQSPIQLTTSSAQVVSN